jgi:hypothetical protein
MVRRAVQEAAEDGVLLFGLDANVLVAFGPQQRPEASTWDHDHACVVRRHVLLLLDAMLEAQLVVEDELLEPDCFFVDEGWRPFGGRLLDYSPTSAACPPASVACPPGLEAVAACPRVPDVNALTLVGLFGNREQAKVLGMGVVGNLSYDQKHMWVALAVGQVSNERFVAEAIDGHVTLLYGRGGAIAHFDRVLDNMRRHIRSKAWKKEKDFVAQAQWEYAEEVYAWVDILVQCPLHGALHALVHAGLAGIPPGGFLRKQVCDEQERAC